MKELDFSPVTITSKWYVEYTKNMLQSLKALDSSKFIKTYCLDNDSYEILFQEGFNVSKIKLDHKLNDQPTHFGTEEFNKFMYYKMKVIKNELNKNNYVLYVDGDVVFKKNLNQITKYFEDCDLLAIKDFDVKNPKKVSICAGFMLVRSNLKTKKIFNPKLIAKNNFRIQDQEIINSKRKWLNYKYFDENLFCNGSYFEKNYQNLNPHVVHFNYIVGERKKETMKKYGYWFL